MLGGVTGWAQRVCAGGNWVGTKLLGWWGNWVDTKRCWLGGNWVGAKRCSGGDQRGVGGM